LYKVHKGCTYSKVVYKEILRAFIEAEDDIDNDGWAKMIENALLAFRFRYTERRIL